MADIHVLTESRKGSWRVVMHFAVPDITSIVGVPYRTALVASGLGGSTQLPDGDGLVGTISAAEKAQIEAGEVAEVAIEFLVESNGDATASVRNSLRECHARRMAEYLAAMRRKLKYFGHTESKE